MRGRRRSSRSGLLRGLFWQAVVLGAVGLLVWVLVRNTLSNLEQRHVATGFAFLGRVTGVPIGSTVLDYDPTTSTYGLAFLIGIINTLRVWIVSAIAATVLGVVAGLSKLSRNWLLRTTASWYVGAIRNVPCLLQILFWVALIEHLGAPDAALKPLPGVYLSNRGLAFPWIDAQPGFQWTMVALAAGVVLFGLIRRLLRGRDAMAAKPGMSWGLAFLLVVGLPLAAFMLTGMPATWEVPEPSLFDFTGGAQVTSEFAALAIGLSVYSSGYIAEVVRAGVLAVPRGQWEAASSINLGMPATLRWVVLPQALRAIVPPLTSQYLGLLKNSSLAIVIGYQDIVAVANLSLTQTGQAVEAVILIMAVYLSLSVLISVPLNLYNARVLARGAR
ncbi:MAG: ABC transporter permease subunit [Rubrivivax sp.]